MPISPYDDNLDLARDVVRSKTDGADTAAAYALIDIAESLRIIVQAYAVNAMRAHAAERETK